MSYYKYWWHTVYDCRYHLVWITKYRKHWIHEKIMPILEEILRDLCEELFVKIISIWMERDHVHMYISIPLQTWHIPDVVQKLKWWSSKILWDDDRLKKWFKNFYWKEWVWKRARWYFICTVWEVNDKLIKEYIEQQWQNEVKLD